MATTILPLQILFYFLFMLVGFALSLLGLFYLFRKLDKTKLKEYLGELSNTDGEFIKVGELTLMSRHLYINELSALGIELLKNKEVKEYLNLIDRKKQGGYFG